MAHSDGIQQLGMLGVPDEAASQRGRPIGLAELDPSVGTLASALPAGLRLGTSSWSFLGWTGLVYDHSPSQQRLSREGLSAYAKHPLLRAVGIDSSYYAPPSTATLQRYAAQVPADFRFLAKAWEPLLCARYPKHARYGADAGRRSGYFLDAAYAQDQVVAPFVEGLGDNGGVLLFQFPPQDPEEVGTPGDFADALHRFLSALPKGPCYAVEVRNRAWLTPQYAAALVDAGAVHAYSVHPTLPPISQQMRLVPGGARHGLVIRWMLQPGLTYTTARARFQPFDRLAGPDPQTRAELARLIDLALDRDKEVLVIANNKAEGCSPLTLQALAREVTNKA